jgi:hypothetical protein
MQFIIQNGIDEQCRNSTVPTNATGEKKLAGKLGNFRVGLAHGFEGRGLENQPTLPHHRCRQGGYPDALTYTTNGDEQ